MNIYKEMESKSQIQNHFEWNMGVIAYLFKLMKRSNFHRE